MLTSATMRLNPDEYIAFLFDPENDFLMPLEHFCEVNVEPMGMEAGKSVMFMSCSLHGS